ncbi:MAG: hypothetical protein JNK81_02225 [Anaerolineales bacterium]|nr:hypothetical protein [Anaerolineales bacterium]
MQIKISTTLPCSTERVWQEVQTTKLLLYIAYPLVVFESVKPNIFPEVWSDKSYLVRMRVFGFIPFGEQWIVIKRNITEEKFELLDDGHSNIIKQWKHLITLKQTPEGFTRYTDTIDINAGLLTFGAWLFANIFYRHRQSRWHKLISKNFNYE